MTEFAKQDIKNAKDYYKNINPNLAILFLEWIKEASLFISENPNANDTMYRDIKMHLVKQFPYHLHYYIDVEKDIIVILAIEFAKRENLDFSDRI